MAYSPQLPPQKEPTRQQRELMDTLAEEVKAMPKWLARWTTHVEGCRDCIIAKTVAVLCQHGQELYRLALNEAYPEKKWAQAQPPVWAVLEELGGATVVGVRPCSA